MNDEILDTINAAIADIERRLEQGPPCFKSLSNDKLERASHFFDGMPQYDASKFPDELQQYIVAFSGVPTAAFNPSAVGVRAREFRLEYGDRPYFEGSIPIIGSYSRRFYYSHEGIPEYVRNEFLSFDPSECYKLAHVHAAYGELLNIHRLNRLPVPASFNSLQIYSFFKERNLIKEFIVASANGIMEQIVEKVNQLEGLQRTRDEVVSIVCQTTGLPANGACVPSLIASWALCQRIGVYASESDQNLANVFFEVLRDFGHMDRYHLHFAIDRACHEKGLRGIKTPGSVPGVMSNVLGSYYFDVMELLRKNRKPENPKLGKLAIISPHEIKPADTVSADVRQIIEEETLGTGARDTSSLNHSALFRHPKVPSAQRRFKANKHEP
jgi:hypothetical protein